MMTSISRNSLFARLGSWIGIAVLLMGIPGQISASTTTSVSVRQILPAGGENACRQIGATAPHPYIYDGELHSFDITVNDSSYVAIGGTVGAATVAAHFFSRWMNPDGSVRIHTDIYRTSLAQDLPITMTLISVHGGVTCIATIATYIPKSVPSTGPVGIPVSGPTTGTGTGPGSAVSVLQPNRQVSKQISKTGRPATHRPGTTSNNTPPPLYQASSSTEANASSAPMFVGALHSVGNMCVAGGSVKLWVILLVLYALFVLVLLLQAADFLGTHTYEWNAALILSIFLGLLTFWYLSAACRAGPWVAIFASLIAFIGLFAGLFEPGSNPTPPTLLLNKPKEEPKLGEGRIVNSKAEKSKV